MIGGLGQWLRNVLANLLGNLEKQFGIFTGKGVCI
jgi:hypothetical protein